MGIWYKLYTRRDPPCPYCTEARELLQIFGKDFYEFDLDDKGVREMFKERNFRTVPQIFREQQHIGGCKELRELLINEQKEEEYRHRNHRESNL